MGIFFIISLALVKMIGSIPVRAAGFVLTRLSLFIYYVDKKHRDITIENLKTAFGNEKSEKDIKSIAKKAYENLSLTFLDFCRIPKLTRENLNDIVTFENIDYVWSALARGKGIVFCTAHFGSWEILPHLFAISHKPFNIIVRPLDSRVLDMVVSKYRSHSGNKIIAKKNGMKHILRALQKKEIIGTLNDQNVKHSEGVFVDFFGKKACTNFALALLSLRTDVPVIPVFIIREGLSKHRVKFEKPVEIEKGIDRKKYLVDFTQAITTVIENYVREYPEQWFWVHRRWKTRPKVLIKKYKEKDFTRDQYVVMTNDKAQNTK
ncbi:MAG: hypothetical protein A2149_03080 [Candidatus Schekmanbacteria bacterium RBG_16_38_11]|uniref:Lipid A biosynthesis acyltransferase n=1 Tax=Candidatus Schekmanbacteria bacterium RBG_16_38_11 TaxID=1817880 RepID=A0A1F7RU86_9BACT|nr:MAG: hypothetical protein A2149_03080 [Candidatus Schekmanbacteria bacterium RBG_16_38_11]